jgi:hypothetical protein
LQFTVDGLPVDAVRRPAADDAPAATWMVPLASQASTSRVEMLFFAASAIPQSLPGWPRRCSFVAPKLGDLPVERTVWTIAAPRTFQPAEGEKGSDTVSQEQGGFSRVGGRENGSDPSFPLASANVAAGDIAAQWQRFVAEGQASVSSAAPGPNDVVALEYRPIEPRAWLPRLAGIAGFLVIVGLAGLIVRLGLLRSVIVRWPAVFGVGFGLAWWLWLSPSAVGLLIVLVVLLCRFLPRKLLGRPAAAAG